MIFLCLTSADRADAGRTRPERPDYPGTENAARRIADLEREVKQREQSREHSSLKERLEENKRIVAERERENARCRNHDRGMSRQAKAGRYKAKTAMYEALMFLLIWYSVSTTLFQIILSKIFISDCVVFFDTIATFVQTIAGWIIPATKSIAQISNGISNPVVAGIVYWLIRILICGGCLVGAGRRIETICKT